LITSSDNPHSVRKFHLKLTLRFMLIDWWTGSLFDVFRKLFILSVN
jgi:hypothetical protein